MPEGECELDRASASDLARLNSERRSRTSHARSGRPTPNLQALLLQTLMCAPLLLVSDVAPSHIALTPHHRRLRAQARNAVPDSDDDSLEL